MSRSLGLPMVAVAALSYMVWHVATSSQATPQTEPVIRPSRAPFNDVVAGVGLIEPKSENIEVAAITPGTVVEVEVSEGAEVAAGDVLFRLDDRQLQAELSVQQSLLDEAQATLDRWRQMPRPEDLPPSAARVKKFQADVELRLDQLQRTRGLVAKNAMAEQELVEREQAHQAAQAELTQALAEDARLKAGAWQADVAVAQAQVARMEAQVALARVELDRLAVRSPIAGRVLKVDVRPGEYVGTPPGKPLVILGDVSTLHVRVDIDEQDLPRLEPGMPGQGFVRGDAERPLQLSFVRIEPFTEPKRSLTGAGNERIDTRVLQVIYAIESAPREVYVGQQIDVFLDRTQNAAAAPDASSTSAGPVSPQVQR